MTVTHRSHSSSGRYDPRTNTDNIKNPNFKLPFNHGWIRELVRRSPKNKSKIQSDVYYYSQHNKKLRSLNEIQKQLNSETTPLTIKNFTFIKQPIGMNEPYEIIRDAFSKDNRRFVGRRPRPRIMEVEDAVIDNVEPLNRTTSTPERQASQSRVSPPKKAKFNDMDNSTNVKQRTSENNGLPSSGQVSNMQLFNDMSKALKCVFSYLKMEDLITLMRVCSSWRYIAMDTSLWQNIRLKNVLVGNWEKCIDFINTQRSISLDTIGMLMPSKGQDFDLFWSNFSKAIPNATTIETFKLQKCPLRVVHGIMYSFPLLKKLNATLIKNAYAPEDAKIVNELMSFNMDYVSDMINLTELQINGQTGIQILKSPEVTFSHLTKLKTLSLTSIKSFPKDICTGLGIISTDLEILEIGDCEYLPDDFPVFLKKLTNLRSLRLENCEKRWETFSKENFEAIRSLKKLKKLELINIEFSDHVKQQLEKCNGLTALLIIPTYFSDAATTNRHLLDCLEKLSKKLTHVVWGLTLQLLGVVDTFFTQYQQNLHNLSFRINMSETREPYNNIPILRSRKLKLKLQPEDIKIPEIDKSDTIDILPVPFLQGRLDSMMVNAKTKVIKICYSATTQTHLSEQFDDL